MPVVTRRRHRRKGAVTVEFAFVAPVLFLLIFALVEMSRAHMALHSLEEAARAGCRTAILANVTQAEVEAEIFAVVSAAGINPDTVTIGYDPLNLSSAEQWSPVTITVSVTYNDINWVPVPQYFGGIQLSASSTLPREADDDAAG